MKWMVHVRDRSRVLGVALAAVLACSGSRAAVIDGPRVNPVNGNSYLLLAPASWTASQAEAASLGGYLTTIEDDAENGFIAASFGIADTVFRDLWIGLNAATNPGQFVWANGSPSAYRNWAPGQPTPGAHYAHLIGSPFSADFGRWRSVTDGTPGIHGVVEIEPTLARWLLPVSGSWTDAAPWSTAPNFPNNGTPVGATYRAVIDAQGSPYTVSLAGGSITVNRLDVASPSATLLQQGGALSVPGSIFIAGAGGAPVHRLEGGTLSIAGDLSLGRDAGTAGRFEQSGGSLDVTDLSVARVGAGTLLLSNGELSAAVLTVAESVGSSGHVEVAGGVLAVEKAVAIGRAGAGVLTQTGGQVSSLTSFSVGTLAGSSGRYAISGGTLSTPILSVGNAGSALFQQDGGHVAVSSVLRVAGPAGRGRYELSAGTLSAGTLALGNANSVFLRTGGAVNVGTLQQAAGVATFTNAGDLRVGRAALNGGSLNVAAATLTLSNGIAFAGGVVNLWSAPGVAGVIEFAGAQSITGVGTVQMNAAASPTRLHVAAGTLTIAPSATVVFGDGAAPAVSDGVVSGAPGALLVNAGTMTTRLNGASTLSISGPFLNNGLLEARGPAAVIVDSAQTLNYAGGVLVGGRWRAGNATLVLSGATITTNAAEILLDGTLSTFSAVDPLAVNDGTLAVSGGRVFSTVGTLTNNGTLIAASGGVLNVAGGVNNGAIVADGGTINFTQATVHTGTASIGGVGTAVFTSGNQTIGGSITQSAITFLGGTTTFASTALLTPEQVNVVGGRNTLAAGGSMSIGASGTAPGLNFLGGDSPTFAMGGATITLAGGSVSVASHPSGTAQLTGPDGTLDLGGATRLFDVASGSARDDLLIEPRVINGGIRKTGPGMLRLAAGGATLTALALEGGTVEVVAGGLGSGTVTFDGGRLGVVADGAAGFVNVLRAASPADEMWIDLVKADGGDAPEVGFAPRAVLGSRLSVTGVGSFGVGGGTLTSDLIVNATPSVAFTGPLSGGFRLILGEPAPALGFARKPDGLPGQNRPTSVGTVTIGGASSNTHGATAVNSGLANLNNSSVTRDGAIPGDLEINGGTVRLLQSEQISDAATVTVRGDGVFDLNGFEETISRLVIEGDASFGTSGTLKVGTELHNEGLFTFGGTLTILNAVRATAGVLTIDGAISNWVDGSLRGEQQWTIDATFAPAAVDVTAAGSITLLESGTGVTLRGAASRFDAIAPLARNAGKFEIDAGRSFTTIGDLVNEKGTITVGAAAVLTVNGAFSNSREGQVVLNGGTMVVAGSPTETFEFIGLWTLNPGSTLDLSAVGGLTENAGVLTLSSGSTFLGIEQLVSNRGNLKVGRDHTLALPQALSNTRIVQIEDRAVLDIDGVLDNSGTVTLRTDALLSVDDSWQNAGTITVLGDILIDYEGASPMPAVLSQLQSGYAGGTWLGAGIRRGAMGAAFGLGAGEASSLGWTDFRGVALDATAVVITPALLGDANLDGRVDVSDLGSFAGSWQAAGGWTEGDFDYTGFVDVGDLGALAANWLAGVTGPAEARSFERALAAVGLGSVALPEPAGLWFALPLLAARRKRATGRRGSMIA